jgi:hypothetical protein
MRLVVALTLVIVSIWQLCLAQETLDGLRGDPEAIAEAEAMVATMGGMEIWRQLESVHFVHEWFPFYRVDSYLENEILDLTGPRSWVEM